MKTLFVTSPFGRRHGLSSWVQPLEPPPAAATSSNLNACPISGHSDYFTLRRADSNELVTGSPLTRAEIPGIAAGQGVSYPDSCPALPPGTKLTVPCNISPTRDAMYDIISGQNFLEQDGQFDQSHPLCPPTSSGGGGGGATPVTTTTPTATTTPSTTTSPTPSATTTPGPSTTVMPSVEVPPTGVPAPTGVQPGGAVPTSGPGQFRIDIQAFTPGPQGMGPIPVQNLPAPPPRAAVPTSVPPAQPPPPPPEMPLAPATKDLSGVIGIGAVVLGGVAYAIFG